MNFYKLIYHLRAVMEKIIFYVVYGKKISWGEKITWRKSLSIMIANDGKLELGDNVFFNNYCSINVNNRVSIGSNTIVGENVKIYDHNHRFNKPGVIKSQGFSNGKVVVGKNCWIGSNVTILKDSIIGDNCVIGAGIVVKGNIPNDSIVKNSGKVCIEKITKSVE